MEAFKEQAEIHQFKSWAENLKLKLQIMGVTPNLAEEYNNLDKQIQDAILHAAKKTIKKKYGYCRLILERQDIWYHSGGSGLSS